MKVYLVWYSMPYEGGGYLEPFYLKREDAEARRIKEEKEDPAYTYYVEEVEVV